MLGSKGQDRFSSPVIRAVARIAKTNNFRNVQNVAFVTILYMYN
jgi:hypothetical protein